MKTTSFIFLLLAVTISYSADAPETPKEPPTILLFSDAAKAGKGLLIMILGPVELPANHKPKITYRIVNLMEEEVFVEVPTDQQLGHTYELDDGESHSGSGGGGAETVFPDNVNLLKRLHATSYRNGKRSTCGCAIADVDASIELPEFATAKGKTTVTIHIKGFYRSNGKPFSEYIDLPLPLKDK